MKSLQLVLIFAIFISMKFSSDGQLTTAREFRIIRFNSCEDDEKNPMHLISLIFAKSKANKFVINGEFNTTANVIGPVEV